MISLNVNVDHAATLRNARGGTEPDPVTVALEAEIAGATGIVSHLREDRRHIKDRDLYRLKEQIQTRLDMEMAANDEIVKIALDVKPSLVTIVPEKRQELTTEGGLNVAGDKKKFLKLSDQMHEKEIEVSYFIEPTKEQIDACVAVQADLVELHTGKYANLTGKDQYQEYLRIRDAAKYARDCGLVIAAGHGLTYSNTAMLCNIEEFHEFSIGHSIIAHSLYTGISQAVRDMLYIINTACLGR